MAVARAMDDAVDEIGRVVRRRTAWTPGTEGGLDLGAAPRRPRTAAGRRPVEACRAARGGGAATWRCAADERPGPGGARRSCGPGRSCRARPRSSRRALARGLRRVALERGVVIHEGTRVTELDGRAARLARVGVGARRRGRRPPVACRSPGPRPDDVGGGRRARCIGGSAVVALNAWAAAWPSFGRRLVTWSSYIVLTEPIPDRLADIGWTGGEGLADARFTLHYLRTTPDGRIAIGGGGGRAGFGGRIGPAFTDDAASAARAAAGLRRLFPSLRDVRIEDAWGGPIDITADHLPVVRVRPGGGRSTTRTGTRGTASGRRSWAGGSWPALAAGGAGGPTTPLAPPAPAAGGRGRSRRSRSGMPARGSSARRSCAARQPRSAASRSARSCARSPGSRAGWATTSRRTDRAARSRRGRRSGPSGIGPSGVRLMPPHALACSASFRRAGVPVNSRPPAQARHARRRAVQARHRRVQAPGPDDHLHLRLARQLGHDRPRRLRVDGPPLRGSRQEALRLARRRSARSLDHRPRARASHRPGVVTPPRRPC